MKAQPASDSIICYEKIKTVFWKRQWTSFDNLCRSVIFHVCYFLHWTTETDFLWLLTLILFWHLDVTLSPIRVTDKFTATLTNCGAYCQFWKINVRETRMCTYHMSLDTIFSAVKLFTYHVYHTRQSTEQYIYIYTLVLNIYLPYQEEHFSTIKSYKINFYGFVFVLSYSTAL